MDLPPMASAQDTHTLNRNDKVNPWATVSSSTVDVDDA